MAIRKYMFFKFLYNPYTVEIMKKRIQIRKQCVSSKYLATKSNIRALAYIRKNDMKGR